uniref:Uncharacterized protein n=1 Tax=Nosema pernyi TaxID=1112939 RepID=X5E4L9_9MICR|nr:hypothetical protein NP_06D02 [Nosema pernyi]
MRFGIFFSIINVIVYCYNLVDINLHELENAMCEGQPSAVIRPSIPVNHSYTTSRVSSSMINRPVIIDSVNLSSDLPPPYEVAIKLVNPSNIAEIQSTEPPKYEDALNQTCCVLYQSHLGNEDSRESEKRDRLGLKRFKKFCYKFAIVFTLLLFFSLGIYLFIFISPIGGIVLGTISIAVLVFYLQIFVCNYY